MEQSAHLTWLTFGSLLILQLYFTVRALLRPHREPASRLAWVVVIIVAPLVGIVAYLLFGEANIGRHRVARFRRALGRLPAIDELGADIREASIPERYVVPFKVGHSISGYAPTAGNSATLLPDSDAAIDAMVADIDAASEHVHLLFYIWLTDTNGLKMIEAAKRAARRGVDCRVMVDDLGSRALIRSPHWQDMGDAGVRLARALPIGNPLLRPFRGRIDMRNHRKIAVIDNRVTYCGSLNCADAAFAIKARFAPWVDIMLRFEGPVVRQNQHLFAGDWMAHVKEDLAPLLWEPARHVSDGFIAQVIGTGAMVRYSAMPEVFVSLMNAAKRELVITTPYYVPDEPIQAALCAAARRGVATSIIFPRRNDSWIVAAASRSYYKDLLDAGVRIHEFEPGLLHAKSLTVDGEVTLIGSANIDRRSFELNSENSILLMDAGVTGAIRARQHSYICQSVRIEVGAVAQWSTPRQLWNNTVAMLGPVL
ncbi:cardiolipin synthase [Arvimicrobium flavum]|uniref:cardiolipin synthase n=1 Tax=Arvimicrobium flavum TaxID=3393320 RepID=UPI00237C3710|nr:cardiolipin synthase [Mesorhizobium shangrilense]